VLSHRGLFMILFVACQGHGQRAGPKNGGGPNEASQAFVLNVGGTVSGKAGPRSLLLTPTLHSGDQIRLTVRTTAASVVYVAYCDGQQTSAVYPPAGDLAVSPDKDVHVPEDGYFQLDTQVGLETIYVVAVAAGSRLDHLDPELASTIDRGRQRRRGGLCALERGMSKRAGSSRPSDGGQSKQRNAGTARRPLSQAAFEPGRANPVPAVPAVYRPRGVAVQMESNIMASVRSDPAGIAILAIEFSHVP
jgi:hypothetical protein